MNTEMSPDQLLTPAEVASILFVDPKTVTRWARAGKIDAIRTPGGHRRYLRSDVLAIMTGEHHSQKSEPSVPAQDTEGPDLSVVPSATTELPDTDAEGPEALALALEAEAEDAAQAVIASAAALSLAAEKAAAAAARARGARAFASAEAARVPAQRGS